MPFPLAPGRLAPGVAPGEPQLQAQGQVVPGVVRAARQVGPGVTPGQPQPLIHHPRAQRQVALATHLMQGQVIRAPLNTTPVARLPQAAILLHTAPSSADSRSGHSIPKRPANSPTNSPANSPADSPPHTHPTAHMTALRRHRSYLICH